MNRERKPRSKPIDIADELGWMESAVEAAKLLAQMAEGDPDRAAHLATNVHSVLRLAADRLRDLSRKVEEGGPPISSKTRRR